MKKIVFLVSMMVFLCTACDPQNVVEKQDVLSPSFINIQPQARMSRAIVVDPNDPSVIGPLLYRMFSPVISTFENRALSTSNSYEVTLLDTPVIITYEGTKDGISTFTGRSNDEESIYLKVEYNTATRTYSYLQFFWIDAPSTDPDMSEDMFLLVVGEAIVLDENNGSHGDVTCYIVHQPDKEGASMEMAVGLGEYYSNGNLSATAIKSMIGGANLDPQNPIQRFPVPGLDELNTWPDERDWRYISQRLSKHSRKCPLLF